MLQNCRYGAHIYVELSISSFVCVESVQEDLTIPSDRNLTIPLNVTSSSFLESLEHVVLYVSASHANRGDISIDVSGPLLHTVKLCRNSNFLSEEEVEYIKFNTLVYKKESKSHK